MEQILWRNLENLFEIEEVPTMDHPLWPEKANIVNSILRLPFWRDSEGNAWFAFLLNFQLQILANRNY